VRYRGLPEMFATGFSMNVTALAEEENGETSLLLSGLAREYGLNLIAGLAMKRADESKGRNSALAYDRSGRLLANYSKQYPSPLRERTDITQPGPTPFFSASMICRQAFSSAMT